MRRTTIRRCPDCATRTRDRASKVITRPGKGVCSKCCLFPYKIYWPRCARNRGGGAGGEREPDVSHQTSKWIHRMQRGKLMPVATGAAIAQVTWDCDRCGTGSATGQTETRRIETRAAGRVMYPGTNTPRIRSKNTEQHVYSNRLIGKGARCKYRNCVYPRMPQHRFTNTRLAGPAFCGHFPAREFFSAVDPLSS